MWITFSKHSFLTIWRGSEYTSDDKERVEDLKLQLTNYHKYRNESLQMAPSGRF